MRPAQSPGPAPVSSPRMAATERAERLLAARRAKSVRATPPARRAAADRRRRRGAPAGACRDPWPFRVLLGLALAAAMCAEVYLAVTGVALGSGQIVLALGLVLDRLRPRPGSARGNQDRAAGLGVGMRRDR